ncbi:lycopene cyclase domain-containing protein [Brevibacterium litoralis]|uniref:lycopene cyclase domain-containing protein n=1 Tax=Brevibacterium litoralis TaxID=3138935 RepID=UPI0032EC762D
MTWLYLGCLLFSLFGMCMLDWRHRLFWFADWRRAALVHASAVVLFLAWDAAGILTGSFFRGDSGYFTGIELAPDMPLEEPVFLFFLCWLTMNVYCGSVRLLAHLRGRTRTDEEVHP